MPRPRVSLCMIVRNEEANLRACLEPVASIFDELVVVDTGSVDGTKALAFELGARVFDFPWCDDFAAARNESLRHATGDWIFWLDADDRLDEANVQKLRQLLDRLPDEDAAFMMNCVCVPTHSTNATTVIPHCRLFRRHDKARWQQRVHEQIMPSLERLGYAIRSADVRIDHLGYQDPAQLRRKLNRDCRLLRLEYASNPCNPATLYNLGQAHSKLGQDNDALTYYLTALQYAPPTGDWLRVLYRHTGMLLLKMQRREEAISIFQQGLDRFPGDVGLMTALADQYWDLGQLGRAERFILQILSAPPEETHAPIEQNLVNRSDLHLRLACLYMDEGRLVEAERSLQELLAQNPDFIEAWVWLATLYIHLKQPTKVDFVKRQLAKLPSGNIYADLVAAKHHMALGNFVEAREILERTISEVPRMVFARLLMAECLVSMDAPLEECIAAHRDVLRLDPSKVAIQESLSFLLRKQQMASEMPSAYTLDIGPTATMRAPVEGS